jgi:hypothetical protein
VLTTINSVFVVLLVALLVPDVDAENNPIDNFGSRWFVEIGPTLFLFVVVKIVTSIALAPVMLLVK